MDLSHVYQRTIDPNGDDSLGKLARLIKPGSTILELGPAMGYFTRYLREELNCTIDCVEYSAEMAEVAQKYARTMWVSDLDQVELGERFPPGTYDYVISADVLEHLRNPWRLMEMCRPLLTAGGRFLISIPNVGHAALIAELISGRFDYREEGLLDRTHLRLFTRKSVVDMLERCGYRPISIDRVEWMAERTEFNRTLENLPPRLRDYLLSHPDSLTYQFIIEAEVGDMTEELRQSFVSKISGPTDPFFVAKIYWASPEENLWEDRCYRQSIKLGEAKSLIRCDLPVDCVLNEIRFDPADRAGYLNVYRISIVECDSAGSECDRHISFDSAETILKGCRLVNLIGGNNDDKLFVSTNDDPQIFVQPKSPIQPQPGRFLRFEAEIGWPMSPDYLVAEGIIKSEVIETRSRESSLQDQINDLRSALDAKEREAADARLRIENEMQRAQLAENELNEIRGSKAWALIMRYRKLKGLIRRSK